MKSKLLLSGIVLFIALSNIYSQKQNFPFSANLKVSEEIKGQFIENGRLYLFLSKNANAEPRTQTWPSPTNKTYIFAKNMEGYQPDGILEIQNDKSWISTATWTLDQVPAGEYYVQILWDQDLNESRIDAPG
ncbi:MAG: hypothetical protein WBN11_15625, partial [Eudoraea sp.]